MVVLAAVLYSSHRMPARSWPVLVLQDFPCGSGWIQDPAGGVVLAVTVPAVWESLQKKGDCTAEEFQAGQECLGICCSRNSEIGIVPLGIFNGEKCVSVVADDVQVRVGKDSHHPPNPWPWPTRWA